MKALQVLIATLALGCAFAGAAEPRIGKFVKYDAGEFTIVTSRHVSQAQRFMEDLAKFRITLERVLGRRAAKNSVQTTIVIANGSDWHAWFEPRGQRLAGFFQQSGFSNYMAMDGDASLKDALITVFHEYTHYYLDSQFGGEYPPWFHEGLAQLMGNARFEKGKVILGIPFWSVFQAQDGTWIPFDRILSVDQYDPEYRSHRLVYSFYAQSWLSVHYGMVENREFGRQILEYLSQLNRLVPQEEAAKNAFGDLKAADKLLRDYRWKGSYSQGGLDLGVLPEFVLPEGKPLDEIEAMSLLADLMLETGLPTDRVRPLVDSLERRDNNKARAAVFAARLAQAAEDNAAFDGAVERAEAALSPEDWEQRRELAVVLLAGGLDRNPLGARASADAERDVQRAMRLLAEAISINSRDVETLWGFGAAAVHLNRNLDLAEQALLAAYKVSPSNPDIAVALAELKWQQGKHAEMIPYLENAARYTGDLDTRRWALERIEQTKATIQKWSEK